MSKKGMSDEMDKLNIDLKNCYGIKTLKRQFDFSEHTVFAIYAPNASMKSSLAQTFKDVAAGAQSNDRIFPDRVCQRKITDENEVDLPMESVFVVRPYDEEVGHTEKTSTLLVNSTLRKETVFVVDDIADSFDYQNKYAIIQYLQDIAEEPYFKQIILTHNFDFFRTISSRFVRYSHCLMASKSSTGIALEQAAGIKNVFVNDWKPSFFTDPKKRIASIPFIRNIIEYTKGDDDPGFIRLSCLLHWKPDSVVITQTELDSIYNTVFGTTGASADGSSLVIDVIRREASECLSAGDGFNFENKIVLSIAIRLAAEQFMANRINDAKFVSAINSNQTPTLLKQFKDMFSSEIGNIKTIERVILMTPENIHLNSFMYEPIVDMSAEHLKKLYQEVLALQGGSE